ncbi:PH domain-containing protein [Flavobacterium humi]|uniref:PH domain-containing protein n=2 Tax=Flavobacterium humi TaxID=2562683 RepID=A0A4Z0LBP6_9FLAO|nr:PH domain-containing protein [Flavobacterium humi]
MENFTNETIDIGSLPKFEEVRFTALHPDYWKVVIIQWAVFFLIAATLLGFALFCVDDFAGFRLAASIAFLLIVVLSLFFSRIGFRKKAFAFRHHDVLFRHGVIATNTVVIPYNRVQHVALHEGLVSRYFGLAKIEIFTAGGNSSDIEIPGIQKEQAENIKQLLMGKIQKQL